MIPFNLPAIVGNELEYIQQAVELGELSGEGVFARKCARAIADLLGEQSQVILTPSCTAALEMCALLLDLGPGDEVIMPSFTFVSTGNAFTLRGVKPVFADMDPETMNISPSEIRRLITKNTKAIVVVHYAGWACEMDQIMAISKEFEIPVIEDAAHALGSKYKGRKLGTFGALATFSFHETKNITCGEGGALVINDPRLVDRAYILRDKGTNRRNFSRGEVPFYTWVDHGSSYVISDVLAAFLYAQLENVSIINQRRWEIVRSYSEGLKELRTMGKIWFPEYFLKDESAESANGHLYFLLAFDEKERKELQKFLSDSKVGSAFHYQPLHLSPFVTSRWGAQESLPVTEEVAGRLLRLPLYFRLSDSFLNYVVRNVHAFYQGQELQRQKEFERLVASNGEVQPAETFSPSVAPILRS